MVGERSKDGSCTFVKTADANWDSVEVEMPASYEDMKNFYGLEKNRLENYNADGEATRGTRKIPCLLLVPTHVGRKVSEGEMTACEVLLLLRKMMQGTTWEPEDLISPALTWALQACCKTRRGANE